MWLSVGGIAILVHIRKSGHEPWRCENLKFRIRPSDAPSPLILARLYLPIVVFEPEEVRGARQIVVEDRHDRDKHLRRLNLVDFIEVRQCQRLFRTENVVDEGLDLLLVRDARAELVPLHVLSEELHALL